MTNVVNQNHGASFYVWNEKLPALVGACDKMRPNHMQGKQLVSIVSSPHLTDMIEKEKEIQIIPNRAE